MKNPIKTPALFFTTVVAMIFAGLFFSCNQTSEHAGHDHSGHNHAMHNPETATGSAKLYAEVMAIHDEVMPKMDDVMALKSQAKRRIEQLDSLAKAGNKLENTEKKQRLDSLVVELGQADDAMMNWMHDFDADMKGKNEDQKLEYLKSEKVKIALVKEKMLGGITKAQAELKE